MKDEIKEMLNHLKDYCEVSIDNKIVLCNRKEMIKLINYITNLQEELKSANESITWWTNRFNAVERDKKDYKSRIDKAIEVISKEFLCYDNESDEYIQGKKVINILNGDEE